MSFWKDKGVLVTGGAGMIGSHLVELLAEQGAEVYILDNFTRPGMVWSCEEAKRHAKKVYCETLGDMDSLNPGSFYGYDAVFHLAARVTGIQFNMANDLLMMQDNLAINHSVTKWVGHFRPGRYIYVSTSCVYPHDAPIPTPETVGDICNPEPTNRGYGIAKWVGEQQTKALHEAGTPSAIVRFYNAAGPRDYYDEETSHVIPALIRRFLEAKAEKDCIPHRVADTGHVYPIGSGREWVTVWGSGNQTRVFVDCRDLARALLVIGEHGCDGQATNVGSRQEVSIRHLASQIAELVGYEGRIVYDKGRPDGYPRRMPDTRRFSEMLGPVWHGFLGPGPEKFFMPLRDTLDAMLFDYRYRYPDGFVGVPSAEEAACCPPVAVSGGCCCD